MKKLITLITFVLFGFTLFSQSIDCASTLSSRKATPPYSYNSSSKSLLCSSNKKYEYSFTLQPGKEYRITFYASTIFNNSMWFTLIDMKTGKTIWHLPGETEENKKGECVLREYFDKVTEKLVYPYFDFEPTESQDLKVIITIPEYKFKIKTSNADPDLGTEATYEERTEKHTGCVTIFIQDKVL